MDVEFAQIDIYQAKLEQYRGEKLKLLKAVKTRSHLLEKARQHSILKALYEPGLEDVMTIKLQILFWLLSAAFVALYQLYFHVQISYAILGAVAMLARSKDRADHARGRLRIIMYCWTLFTLTGTLASFISTALDLLSTHPHTYRQVLVIHWCLSFFVISEAECWRCLSQASWHPVWRDIRPCGVFDPSFRTKDCGSSTLRILLSAIICSYLTTGLRILGQVPGPIPPYAYNSSNALYACRWYGQIPQALVLLRPVKHFAAWATDVMMDVAAMMLARAKVWYNRRNGTWV